MEAAPGRDLQMRDTTVTREGRACRRPCCLPVPGSGAGIADVGRSDMRSPLLFLLAPILLFASPLAQGTREDGLQAFVSGDYASAARILGPLAEAPQSSDGIAQFLMAMLYDTGQGVGRSTSLACGLFQKAAAGTGPFVDQATILARALREGMSPGALSCPLGPPPRPA